MIDDKPGPDFPKKWRSSIAAFYHEPTKNSEYGDRKITYLKIVCTITNYQLTQAERSTDYGWYE